MSTARWEHRNDSLGAIRRALFAMALFPRLTMNNSDAITHSGSPNCLLQFLIAHTPCLYPFQLSKCPVKADIPCKKRGTTIIQRQSAQIKALTGFWVTGSHTISPHPIAFDPLNRDRQGPFSSSPPFIPLGDSFSIAYGMKLCQDHSQLMNIVSSLIKIKIKN